MSYVDCLFCEEEHDICPTQIYVMLYTGSDVWFYDPSNKWHLESNALKVSLCLKFV